MSAPDALVLERSRRRRHVGRARAASIHHVGWLTVAGFLGPTLLLYAGFTLYPILKTIHNSFFVLQGAATPEFVGLQNFHQAFADDSILSWAVQHSLIWSISGPILESALALVLALALYARVPGTRFFRVAWLTPVLLSQVVVGVIWIWVYNTDWGLLSSLLRGVGLGRLVHPWLGNPQTALPSVIVVSIWTFTGFQMVVLLAALSSIPPSLIEAARISGAGWGRIAWSILMPLIRPTIVNLLVLSFIVKMKLFALVWIMTNGGPLWATETISTYVVKRAFYWETFDIGYPSAIATLWFCAMLIITAVIMWSASRREHLEF